MKTKQLFELIIISGNQFVLCHVERDEISLVNDQLKRAVDDSTWFIRNDIVFVRGGTISGWYYRNPMPVAAEEIRRMANILESETDKGDSWKESH